MWGKIFWIANLAFYRFFSLMHKKVTPAVPVTAAAPNGIFRGWMDDALRIGMNQNDNGDESVTYADGLSYHLKK